MTATNPCEGVQGSPKEDVPHYLAVKELKLSYHNGYIYIYIVNNRASPI